MHYAILYGSGNTLEYVTTLGPKNCELGDFSPSPMNTRSRPTVNANNYYNNYNNVQHNAVRSREVNPAHGYSGSFFVCSRLLLCVHKGSFAFVVNVFF